MTELPPIIERLDALKEQGVTYEARGHSDPFGHEVKKAYPELRAELLRLQADRDALLEALKHISELGGEAAGIAQAARAKMEVKDG